MNQGQRTGHRAGIMALRVVGIAVAVVAVVVTGLAWWVWDLAEHQGEGQARDAADIHALFSYDQTIACLEAELAALRPEADHRAVERAMHDCTDDSFFYTLEGQTKQRLLQHHTLSVVMSTVVSDGQVTFVVDTVGDGEAGGPYGDSKSAKTVVCWTIAVDVAARAIVAADDAECDPDGAGSYVRAKDTTVAELRGDVEKVVDRADAGRSGTVTALPIGPGDVMRSGDVVAVIDGVTLVAYAGPRPIGDDDEDHGLYGTRSVATLQRVLAALGYYDGSIDGILGPQSGRALEAFNADMGLTKDLDSVSPATLVWIGPEQFLVSDVWVSVGDQVDGGDALISGSSAWWPAPEAP